MTFDEAISILYLPETFDLGDLKRTRNLRLRQVHPDIGGSDEATKSILEAFEYLKEVAPEVRKESERFTVDGIPLSRLGLGLPPGTFALGTMACDPCGGHGYTSNSTSTRQCGRCHGTTVIHRRQCAVCRGLCFVRGRRCGACSGTGWWKLNPPMQCTDCHGGTTRFYKCYSCDGAGVVVLKNPVIPRNAFNITSKPRKSR